jgi:hypothetical protein
MNKEFITEITRINQLMKTSLIMEAVGGFKSIADEILTYVSKKSGKFSNVVTDLVRKLKNAISEDEITKLIGELINADKELAKIYIPKIMALIPDNEAKQIIKLKKAMKGQLDGGVPLDNVREQAKKWIDKNVITPLDGIKNIYKTEIDDYLLSINKPPTPPTPPKPKPKTVTDVAGQTFEDVTPLTSKDLTALEKMYRQKGLGSSFFKAMRQFSKTVNDMISSSVTLMDETLSLIKELSETTNAAIKSDLGRRIGDNIKTLTQKESVNKQIIDEWIDTNVLDYKLKYKIKDLDGYKKAASIYDNSSLTSWKEKYKGLSERRSLLRTQINSVFNPFSWSAKNLEKHGGALGKWKKIFKNEEFGELRRWLLTGQTQKWSGMKDYANKFGLPKTLMNATKEQLYSYFFLTTAYALADYMTDYLGSVLIEYDWFKDYSWVRKQASGYYENVGYYKQDDTVSQGATIMGKVIWAYMVNEINDLNISFPGLGDDMLKYYGVMNAEDPKTQSEIEELIRKFNDTKEKIKNEKEKLEDTIQPAPENGDDLPPLPPDDNNPPNEDDGRI